MAYCPSNSVPATGPSSARPQESARAQRVNQAQFVEDRLRNGLPPVAIAGVAALLTQLDTMQTLPGVSLSIVTEVAGAGMYQWRLGWLRPYPSFSRRTIHSGIRPQPRYQI